LDEETGQGDGNLTVSVWQIEQTPFSAFTRTTIAEACTRLNFMIYASDGTRVKYVNQTSGTTGFGAATFQLEPATYQVVVVGHSSNGNPTMTDLTKIQFKNNQGFSDTFLTYIEDVEVTAENHTLLVTPQRIVSLCRVEITDDVPETVSQLRFQYKGGSGAFDAHTGLGSVNSIQTMDFDVTGDQKQFDLYTYLHDTEGTIHLTVTALDASGVEILQREFDVSIEKNYITWVSGSFFGSSGSDPTGGAGITSVTVNTDWAGETHVTF
jgi:hypothetical protein